MNRPRSAHSVVAVALLVLTALAAAPGWYDSTREGTQLGPVTVLPAPPWDYTLGRAHEAPIATFALTNLLQEPNAITDDERWFERYGLALPTVDVDRYVWRKTGPVPAETGPFGVPHWFRGARLIRVVDQGTTAFCHYADRYWEARYLVGLDPEARRSRYVLDFGAWQQPPDSLSVDRSFTEQDTRWAVEQDGILYVSHCHRTYAASSGGRNGYITAIDLTDFGTIWRSQPLVANAANFELRGDLIISGYGFTDEPDYVYLLNRHTGAVHERFPVKTAPDYLITRNDSLFVRCYDTDYIFGITAD